MPDSAIEPARLALHHARVTRIGGRETNEDALDCAFAGDAACFVVSDGVGGHEGGEIASAAVVEAVTESFAADPLPRSDALRRHIAHAAQKVERRKAGNGALANMSATVAALIVDAGARRALWAHVGDTRLYLFRQGRLHRVTRDHSLVQQLVEAGYCTPEQAREHPLRNNLIAVVGVDGDEPLEIAQDDIAIAGGDAFLLCTDGLWEWLEPQEMESALAACADAQQWLDALVRLSEEKAGQSSRLRDNYTAFAILIDESGSTLETGS